MDRAEMLERCDRNYAAWLRDSTQLAGGETLDRGGVLHFAGAHWLPVLVNGILRTDTSLAGAETIAHTQRWFAERNRGFTVIVRDHADADLAQATADAGLVPFGEMPGMLLDHPLDERPVPDDVELRWVTDLAIARDYAAVMDAAYSTYGMPAGVASAVLEHMALFEPPRGAGVVAYLEREPVAAAMVWVTDRIAGVNWVGTVEHARGRGLGELVTRAVSNRGFELGATHAFLQASPMGEPVYRRMGYETITRYPYSVRFEPPPT